MVSKINICNLSLAYIGQAPINSFDQTDERAKRINLFYEPVRDEVLRAHNWGFAGTQNKLELSRVDALTGDYLYHYPADALFIREVFVPGQKTPLAFAERFDLPTHGRVLAVKVPGCYAAYTRRIADETQFDPLFVKSFALALAQDLALTLTGDVSLAQRMAQRYTLSLDEARRSNMTENFKIDEPADAFSEVR